MEDVFKPPLVSVIVSNYNYGCFLRSAVESVFAQSYSNLECIVIDDCSTDDSPLILDGIQKDWPDIKCRRLARNSGQSVAILEGFTMSKGNYVLLLDADDFLFPDCIAYQIAVHMASRRHVGFTSADSIQIVNDRVVTARNGNVSAAFLEFGVDRQLLSESAIDRLNAYGFELPRVGVEDVRYIPRSHRGWPWSTTSSMFFRRDALDLVMGAADLASLRISSDNYIAHAVNFLTGSIVIDKPLVGYRLHGSNGFNKRAALDGFLCHARADHQIEKSLQVFLEDIILRFPHYHQYVNEPERLFEISALVDRWMRDTSPDPSKYKSRMVQLLQERRVALAEIVGFNMVDRWLEVASRSKKDEDILEVDDAGTSLSSHTIRSIATEVWFERQRWGLPYKLGKWIKRHRASRSLHARS